MITSPGIGDQAPDFTADTTEGKIKFHDWLGSSYGVLFSHPKDFTPICTTELGYLAKIKGEFDKRNTKVIGLSIDSVGDHKEWSKDIEETQGAAVNYPLIADHDLKVAKAYGMLHPNAGDKAEGRKAETANGHRSEGHHLLGKNRDAQAEHDIGDQQQDDREIERLPRRFRKDRRFRCGRRPGFGRCGRLAHPGFCLIQRHGHRFRVRRREGLAA